MRYWGYLAAKLAAAAAVFYGLFALLYLYWPYERNVFTATPHRFGYDLTFTLVAGLWFLLASGTVSLIVWDQRYRCRVCLRRLRMPVETGSWSGMLQFGRPRIEYICPYGHGTLKEDEVQISGHENPQWKANADLWDELCAPNKESGKQS
jgi:hypothetical protein